MVKSVRKYMYRNNQKLIQINADEFVNFQG